MLQRCQLAWLMLEDYNQHPCIVTSLGKKSLLLRGSFAGMVILQAMRHNESHA